ncbi:MAG: YggS family pyridoxal phosphate-dependent enzyme [Alphaproteobacteria bacterium]|nr:YggS family pyridoxal phosphate-dependent enzyme [Alphaproteobacteria bacterium]|tara:strand:- start:1354 stop:2049 length:696 start_codon:yes stop_codon:yes gene_type:complete
MSLEKVQSDFYDSTSLISPILETIESAKIQANRNQDRIKLIAVSKNVESNKILDVIKSGHRDFGENRVQETLSKWPDICKKHPDIKLHLIGPLQTNKVRDAVSIFNTIHSLDRRKLAEVLAKEFDRTGNRLECFVQVNIGEESQKTGISPNQTNEFVKFCINEHKIPVIGLMCIPPADKDPGPYFAFLFEIAKKNKLAELSMGMSRDYQTAISFGATQVRVGSAIFGSRNK